MTVKPGPKPTKKLTVANIRDAIIRYRGVIAAVAQHFGVSRQTIYNYIQKRRSLLDALEEARETTHDYVESKLLTAIDENHYRAIEFYLSTQARKRGYNRSPSRSIEGITLEEIASRLAKILDPVKGYTERDILDALNDLIGATEANGQGPPMVPPVMIVHKDASAPPEVREQYLKDLKELRPEE